MSKSTLPDESEPKDAEGHCMDPFSGGNSGWHLQVHHVLGAKVAVP